MKRYAAVVAVVAMSIVVVPSSWAQSGGMGGMSGMGGKGGMDMKDMDMGKDKMGKAPAKASEAKRHKGAGTVTAVDNAKGKVTIAHGPVPTLKWPAMTMTFGVKDKALLTKLPAGKKVEFEFVQQGSDYTITSAK